MVAYTAAFLAAANLLALAQAAPAQPVCSAFVTVITGSPIWVPRASATGSAGWGAWPNNGNGDGGNGGKVATTTTTSKPNKPASTTWTTWSTASTTWSTASTTWSTWSTSTPSTTGPYYTTTTTTTPIITTTTPAITTTPIVTTTTPVVTTTTPAAAAPTCDTVTHNIFDASGSGSDCVCDYTINCNRHSPYTSSTTFWEQTSGQIVDTLQECLDICAGNSACTAIVWSNQDGESASDYKRCYQTSGLPQPDSDGYGQLSYKGSCSGSCSNSYINQ